MVEPEGVVGDEGKQDGEGNESVQPGNVCREERGQHLEKYLWDGFFGEL